MSNTVIAIIAKGAIWTLVFKALGIKISAAIAKSVSRGQTNVARGWALEYAVATDAIAEITGARVIISA